MEISESSSLDAKQQYFFALRVPEAMHAPLRLVQDHLPFSGLRLTKTNDFHVTFKFLGEMDLVKELQVRIATKDLIKKMAFALEDLELTFTKVGYFNHKGQPSVVWAGVKMSETLYQFQYELQVLLGSFGFKVEKDRFRPHVTVARLRDVAEATSSDVKAALNQLGVKRQSFSVGTLDLIKSHLKFDEAPEHELVESIEFV
jgi:RNA 2',3'-cyclic 3'-phosphodiesterase